MYLINYYFHFLLNIIINIEYKYFCEIKVSTVLLSLTDKLTIINVQYFID